MSVSLKLGGSRRRFYEYLVLNWNVQCHFRPEMDEIIKRALSLIDGLDGLEAYSAYRAHEARGIIRLSWHNQGFLDAAEKSPDYRAMLEMLIPIGLEADWQKSKASTFWKTVQESGSFICAQSIDEKSKPRAHMPISPNKFDQGSQPDIHGRDIFRAGTSPRRRSPVSMSRDDLPQVRIAKPRSPASVVVLLFALGSRQGQISVANFDWWAAGFMRHYLGIIPDVTHLGCYRDEQTVAAIVLTFSSDQAAVQAQNNQLFRSAKEIARRFGYSMRESRFVDHAYDVAQTLKQGYLTLSELDVS